MIWILWTINSLFSVTNYFIRKRLIYYEFDFATKVRRKAAHLSKLICFQTLLKWLASFATLLQKCREWKRWQEHLRVLWNFVMHDREHQAQFRRSWKYKLENKWRKSCFALQRNSHHSILLSFTKKNSPMEQIFILP